jgi:hypothetical protein
LFNFFENVADWKKIISEKVWITKVFKFVKFQSKKNKLKIG